MKITDENIIYALTYLQRFKDRYGYPGKDTELQDCFQEHAKALLRIVHNKTVSEILGERCKFIKGDPLDIEWLVTEALDRYERYPQPIQFRRIYQEHLPPADGKWYGKEKNDGSN